MLELITANSVRTLSETLALDLGHYPLDSVFTPEIVITLHPAMACWVNNRLCKRLTATANILYPLPASYIWELAQGQLGDLPPLDPFDRETLGWKVYGLLPSLLEQAAFDEPRTYLGDRPDPLKRYQLALRIADAFDRYQLYRPALIRAWDAGEEDHWQAILWRALVEAAGEQGGQHRVATIDRLLHALQHPDQHRPDPDAPQPAPLPQRLSLFNVTTLPPLFMEVVDALAAHTRVVLYLQSPTPEYWADLSSRKTLARKRLEQPDTAPLWEVGNRLLASWGRQGQATQDLLLQGSNTGEGEDLHKEPVADTLLGTIKQDIYRLYDPMQPDAADALPLPLDGSLEVHLCHSPLRECQVLHDYLLGLMNREAGNVAAEDRLRPEDILVMVPDIGAYAPYIEAVFRKDDSDHKPFIPWNLSDITTLDEHPIVRLFLQLLSLPESRFSHSEIASYLDLPELSEHFGLDLEAVDGIKEWLEQARVRWALDGEHKQELGLPATGEHTWRQAERRLFGGYALNEDYADIAPITTVEGGAAEYLGRFWRLLEQLTNYRRSLDTPRDGDRWQQDLGRMLDDFFGQREDEDGRLQKIRDLLATLAEQLQRAELDQPLPLPLVRHWLTLQLRSSPGSRRYFRGGVSFCGMQPMRSVPFRVVCLLGMNDQAFPTPDRPAEFDLMAEAWRHGDPTKGDADRYLFLEALLSAEQRLYISYVGRDPRDNSERQPSVLVRELLDYIDERYAPASADAPGKEPSPASTALTRVHPLQPFSPRNFPDPGDPAPASGFDAYWCRVAEQMRDGAAARPETAPVHWHQHPLPGLPEDLDQLSIDQLRRFLGHPNRYFVQTRLKVYMDELQAVEDDEPFSLDGLDRYQATQRILDDYVQQEARPTEALLRAQGMLPHNVPGELVYQHLEQAAAPLQAQLAPLRGRRPGSVLIDLSLPIDGATGQPKTWLLGGQLSGIYQGLGLFRYRAAKLKGKDLIELWFDYLLLCALESGDRPPPCATLVARDRTLHFPAAALDPHQARSQLAVYLNWYIQGQSLPLPILPTASYAYAEKFHADGDPDKAMKAAQRAWEGNSFQGIPGDQGDEYVQLVTRGLDGNPLQHPDFAALALAFYTPALAACVSEACPDVA